jgi:hypothetical protein
MSIISSPFLAYLSDFRFGLLHGSPSNSSSIKYAKNGEEMMDILVDDIDRYEQLSNREELLTLVSALAGNGAEQDSSAPSHFDTR